MSLISRVHAIGSDEVRSLNEPLFGDRVDEDRTGSLGLPFQDVANHEHGRTRVVVRPTRPSWADYQNRRFRRPFLHLVLTALGQRVIGTSASSILQGLIELARHALSERQRQQCPDKMGLPAESGDIVTHRLSS
jgi:hypothetical protein